jgi:hypothetical protein
MPTCDICLIREQSLFPIIGVRLTWSERAGRQAARLTLCRGCLGDLARAADRRAQAQVERLSA